MKLVLEAANIGMNQYSIIINKVSREVLSEMQNYEVGQEFFVMLNEDLPGTNYIYATLFKNELTGKKNLLASTYLDYDFYLFINNAPMIVILPENVNDIRENEFEAIKDEMELKMLEMKEDFAKREAAFLEQSERLTQSLEEQREHQKHILELHEQTVKSFEQQMTLLKQEQELRIQNLSREQNEKIEQERRANQHLQQQLNEMRNSRGRGRGGGGGHGRGCVIL